MSLQELNSHQEIYEIDRIFRQVEIRRIIHPQIIQQGYILGSAENFIGAGQPGTNLEYKSLSQFG